jgi:hypothetical protein
MNPRKNRATTRPLKLWTRAVQADTTPHIAMQTGCNLLERLFDWRSVGYCAYQIDTWPDSRQQHVGRDLESNVTCKKHRNGSVVLVSDKTEVFFNSLDSCIGEGIAVEITSKCE